MSEPGQPPELEPSDSPSAALEGDLATVTDDEFFVALAGAPVGRDDAGNTYAPTAAVLDLRGMSPEAAAVARADADRAGW